MIAFSDTAAASPGTLTNEATPRMIIQTQPLDSCLDQNVTRVANKANMAVGTITIARRRSRSFLYKTDENAIPATPMISSTHSLKSDNSQETGPSVRRSNPTSAWLKASARPIRTKIVKGSGTRSNFRTVRQVATRCGGMGWLRDGSIPLRFQGGVAAPQ